MFRKLLLPLLAVVLLGGCVSTGYGYRDSPRGDYYHGYPSTEYRVYGDYRYSRGYGYWPYAGYRGWYGPGYSRHYRGGYYGHPGYYRPPIVVRPRPDNGHDRPRNDRDRAPWRDLERLRREQTPTVQRRPLSTAPRPAARPPASAPRPSAPQRSNDRGSRMGKAIRQARGEARQVE